MAKKMITDPGSVTAQNFDMTSLSPEERCHVAIIVMETKRRIELLYLTKVLSDLIA